MKRIDEKKLNRIVKDVINEATLGPELKHGFAPRYCPYCGADRLSKGRNGMLTCGKCGISFRVQEVEPTDKDNLWRK